MFDFQVKVHENGSTVAQLWGEGLDITTVLFGSDIIVVVFTGEDGGERIYMHSPVRECGYEVIAA